MSQQPPEYGLAPSLHEVRKTSKGPWIFFLVATLLAIGAAIYGPRVLDAARPQPAEQTKPLAPPPPIALPAPVRVTRVVVFEVTGTGTAFNITATAGASVHNESRVPLPWTKTVEVPADVLAKSVKLVVVAGPDGAEVHGRYLIDGTTVREGKASGPYGVLTITDS